MPSDDIVNSSDSSDSDVFQNNSNYQFDEINDGHINYNDFIDAPETFQSQAITQNVLPFNPFFTSQSDFSVSQFFEAQIIGTTNKEQAKSLQMFTQMNIQQEDIQEIQEIQEIMKINFVQEQLQTQQIEIGSPNYGHTKKSRRSKHQQTAAQQNMNGDWRKNFLQFVKTSHVEFCFKFKKTRNILLFKKYPELEKFRKNVPKKESFVNLYKVQGLRPYFVEYFRTKVLYRNLMISRVKHSTRLAYSGSIGLFQKAFINMEFNSIM